MDQPQDQPINCYKITKHVRNQISRLKISRNWETIAFAVRKSTSIFPSAFPSQEI